MNEVIGTILEAEARAEEIVRAAQEEAKNILAEGERAAEQVSAEANGSRLFSREQTLAAAQQSAEERYRAILAEGARRAEGFRAACAQKVPAAAQDVLQKVFGA